MAQYRGNYLKAYISNPKTIWHLLILLSVCLFQFTHNVPLLLALTGGSTLLYLLIKMLGSGLASEEPEIVQIVSSENLNKSPKPTPDPGRGPSHVPSRGKVNILILSAEIADNTQYLQVIIKLAGENEEPRSGDRDFFEKVTGASPGQTEVLLTIKPQNINHSIWSSLLSDIKSLPISAELIKRKDEFVPIILVDGEGGSQTASVYMLKY